MPGAEWFSVVVPVYHEEGTIVPDIRSPHRALEEIAHEILFIQRDFVLEHLHLSALEAVNEAFGRWLQDYNVRVAGRTLIAEDSLIHDRLNVPLSDSSDLENSDHSDLE